MLNQLDPVLPRGENVFQKDDLVKNFFICASDIRLPNFLPTDSMAR